MLQISTKYLTKSDIAMVKKYVKFVLDKFVQKSIQSRATIKIKIVHKDDLDDSVDSDDLKRYRAWCFYDGVVNDRRTFTVVLNAQQVKSAAKRQFVRLQPLLVDLGHELIHVKQYLNNEIFDYTDGAVRYKGSYFDSSYQDNEELYYDSPWEIEAYGREQGLFKMFVTKMRGLKKV